MCVKIVYHICVIYSIIYRMSYLHYGLVAQLVEQQPFKLMVVGSSPTRITKEQSYNIIALFFYIISHKRQFSRFSKNSQPFYTFSLTLFYNGYILIIGKVVDCLYIFIKKIYAKIKWTRTCRWQRSWDRSRTRIM